MTARPRVAVILVNYNGRDLLEQYLPSLLDLEYENARIVVVDNDSSDGSVEFLESEFPSVDVVESDENLGFSRGNNAGAATAPDAEYLWFVNTDVEVERESLSRLVEHIESSPRTGMVVPRINYVNDPETIQSVGIDCGRATIPSPRDKGRSAPTDPDPQPVAYGSGAALLVDRDVWDEIGGFDEENFMFGDDIYLGLYCWLLGYRVEAVPDSVVFHEVGGTRERTVDPRLSYHSSRGHVRVAVKLLQWQSLVVGLPRFFVHVLYFAAADAIHDRAPKAACYRLVGFFAPLLAPGALLRERQSVQERRERPDSAFLALDSPESRSGFPGDLLSRYRS